MNLISFYSCHFVLLFLIIISIVDFIKINRMKKFLFLMTILSSVLLSCTKEKTNYESEMEKPVVEEQGFEEVAVITEGSYRIRLMALNGTLYTGYNNLRLTFESLSNGEKLYPSEVSFLPLYSDESKKLSSCPHLNAWERRAKDEDYYSGYTVFNQVTSSARILDVYVSFTINGKMHHVKQRVEVKAQSNKNLSMTEFVGKDGEHYYLSLVAPQKPKVGENTLVAGLYKYNKPFVKSSEDIFPNPEQFSFSQVDNYKIQLDPRMPDPSMGNHSSPNNKDLVQGEDGFYHGVVNYTMTGNWALNFILLNDKGQIQKGTVVPSDFTPGVEGVRSELFIDILF